jgi:hypothetical protein
VPEARWTLFRPRTFFIVSGIIGIVVAVAIGNLVSSRDISPLIILILWPTSIFGFGHDEPLHLTFADSLLLTIELGGNFCFYGLLGLAVFSLFAKFRSPSKS